VLTVVLNVVWFVMFNGVLNVLLNEVFLNVMMNDVLINQLNVRVKRRVDS